MLKRTTVYLDPKLHHALKMKAVHMRTSISGIISDAVKLSLKEDVIDLEAIKNRAQEPSVPYETVLKNLKRDGLL